MADQTHYCSECLRLTAKVERLREQLARVAAAVSVDAVGDGDLDCPWKTDGLVTAAKAIRRSLTKTPEGDRG